MERVLSTMRLLPRARALYDALIAEQVIVRDRSKVRGCTECLRITIGTPGENDKMLAVIKTWNNQ